MKKMRACWDVFIGLRRDPLNPERKRSLTLKHGTGNLHLPGGDIVLDSPRQYAHLRFSRPWPYFWREKRWRLIEVGETDADSVADKKWTFHPKYHNPDPRCRYLDSACDYCWSYANHVDYNNGNTSTPKKFADLDKICLGCEFFKAEIPPLEEE